MLKISSYEGQQIPKNNTSPTNAAVELTKPKTSYGLFGPCKISDMGNKYILTIMDAFTKYSETVAIPNKEAETVADAVFTKWICRYG
jgi:hypothetical protein